MTTITSLLLFIIYFHMGSLKQPNSLKYSPDWNKTVEVKPEDIKDHNIATTTATSSWGSSKIHNRMVILDTEILFQCMRTRNSNYPNNSPVTILRRRNRRRAPNVVEPELCTIVEIAPMAENRTMKELLQAPTKGYGEAIVISEINADHFEIKTNLLQLVQANPFHGFERENPHTHINNFKRITSTLKLIEHIGS
ncbi:hypothetical protein Tco_0554562 [Tanacetum coccineum]